MSLTSVTNPRSQDWPPALMEVSDDELFQTAADAFAQVERERQQAARDVERTLQNKCPPLIYERRQQRLDRLTNAAAILKRISESIALRAEGRVR